MSKRSSSSSSPISSESSYAPENPHSLASLLSKKDQKILGNTREIEWLQRQIADMDMDLHPHVAEQPIPEMLTMEDLYTYRKDIDDKRSELLHVSNYISNKEQILANVQHQHFIEEALYPSPADSMDELKHKRAVENAIARRDQLAMDLMKELEPRLNEKKRLIDIRKEIDRVEEENIALFKAQSSEHKEQLEDKSELLGLLEREGQLQEQTEMVRRVLMGMIVESRLDWANDAYLRKLVLKVGDDFEVVGRKQLMRKIKEGEAHVHFDESDDDKSMPDSPSVTSESMSLDHLSINELLK